MAHNRAEYGVALLGAWFAGCVAVPVNRRLHPLEIRYIIEDSGAAAVFYDAAHQDVVAEACRNVPSSVFVALDAGEDLTLRDLLARGVRRAVAVKVASFDPAWLFYTSGTTGQPKGAVLSHANLLRMVAACNAEVCAFTARDVALHVTPLSHGSGLYLLPSLAAGAENVFLSPGRVEADLILETVERDRATVIPSIPPTVLLMLATASEDRDARSLRCVVYGGAPTHVELLQRALERYGRIFVQIYGQGEAPMTISRLKADEHDISRPDILASAGRPFEHVEVRAAGQDGSFLDAGGVGEIVVRGDVVMRGYWRNEAATAEALRDGWLHTGDVGSIGAEDGRVYLLDRSKDLIITGGLNVYPREVEEALLRHPGVHQVAVVGVPDHVWGERIVAAVVPTGGWDSNETELINFCRTQIAGFKKPREVAFLDALPTNAYGKVLKRELASQFEHGGRPNSTDGVRHQ